MLSDEIITAYSITSEIYQSNELIKNKIVVIRKNISLKQNIIEQNLVDNNYESSIDLDEYEVGDTTRF